MSQSTIEWHHSLAHSRDQIILYWDWGCTRDAVGGGWSGSYAREWVPHPIIVLCTKTLGIELVYIFRLGLMSLRLKCLHWFDVSVTFGTEYFGAMEYFMHV